MSFTIQEIELNSVLKADYVLWYGKEFRNLPQNTQHQLLENLCEWGFGEPPLGCNPLYLQDKERAFMEYTLSLCEGDIGMKPFVLLLPPKIKKYRKWFNEEQNRKFIELFKTK